MFPQRGIKKRFRISEEESSVDEYKQMISIESAYSLNVQSIIEPAVKENQ
jgi:hypothetical protein